MKKITANNIKRLRKRSAVPPILFFLLSLIIGCILVALIVSVGITGMVESRYYDSRRQALSIRDTIKSAIEEGYSYEEILNSIEESAYRPVGITVVSKDEEIISSFGEPFDIKTIDYDFEDLDIQLYFDEESFREKTAENQLKIDMIKIVNSFSKYLCKADESGYDLMLRDEIQKFTYWQRVDVEDESVFICYEQSLYMNDCLMALLTAFVAAGILVVLSFINLINVISNISSQGHMLKMLFKDPVTGGNNVLAFKKYAQKNLTGKMRSSYAIVEFSFMRYQNYCTLYGIPEGEKLLLAIENAFKKYLKRGEFLAREANADYLIFLTNKKAKNAGSEIISRMNFILSDLSISLQNEKLVGYQLQGLNNMVFKAGMYMIPAAMDKESKAKRKELANNIDELIIKAGIAKKGLKEENGLMLYNHEMWEKEMWVRKVEDTMQAALDANEFEVYIQPKYNPTTEELNGGEALVRWISPSEGFVSPGKFIPIFEKTGFITKLDDYMITKTAELQANWYAQGKKIVPISVNVSRIHFAQPDLAEHIRDLVDQFTLPHKYIEIELTESAFFDDKSALLTTVRKLQSYGFEVSMDDFGAGYSSLNSLKDLPLNVLKLDAEFFRGDDCDGRGEVVVAEAIALAKKLNMRIVAEGVERKEQVDFLSSVNCDMIQGFYYAKPMPVVEYETRMQ